MGSFEFCVRVPRTSHFLRKQDLVHLNSKHIGQVGCSRVCGGLVNRTAQIMKPKHLFYSSVGLVLVSKEVGAIPGNLQKRIAPSNCLSPVSQDELVVCTDAETRI